MLRHPLLTWVLLTRKRIRGAQSKGRNRQAQQD